MGRMKWGEVRLGERIYSLAYADDVVLMAEKEEELRSMMERRVFREEEIGIKSE